MSYFNRFYRQLGIRRLQELKNPPINNFAQLTLPRGSVFHYLPESNLIKGIPADHWVVKDSERLVMVEHVQTLSVKEGNPRAITANGERELRNYHRRYRRHKLVKDLDRDIRDDRTMLVINYALLPELYRYTQSVYSQYYQNINLVGTLWDRVNYYAGKVERNHFVEIDLPTVIPALSEFRKAEEKLSRAQMDSFDSLESLLVLDLWRWLGKERGTGTMNVLSENILDRVNLVFRQDNKWILLNLGRVEEWRKGLDEDGQIDPDALQKRFLRLMMALKESAITTTDSAQTPATQTEKVGNKDRGDDGVEEAQKELLENREEDESLEKDLDALRVVANKQEEEDGENPFVSQIEEGEDAYTKGVVDRAETLASEGLITAAELKRYEKLAEQHKTLNNPYTGKGSLVEASKVTHEDVAIDKPTQLSDSSGVVDKSMLETTIQDMDSRYVKNVLPKDIMGSVLNIQKAGIAVTGYEVEHVEDVANEYEIHTVKLNPIKGKSSTIRMKIPYIREDGTFISNGIEFRARRQRVDVPIRKVSPDKVALTSYYGKVFIQRSTKVVHDYGKWLAKSIRTVGLDNEDSRVTNLKSAKSIEDDIEVPRLYSILGHNFLSFTAGGVDFYLNYAKREEHFGEETVKRVEKGGRTIIGLVKRTPVVVDEEDTLYLAKESDLEVLGKIEALVDINVSKAPVDAAELKLFSKTVPLGVALAYYTGLKRLIANLPGQVKRVSTGERLSLSDDEFTIKFNDETLIVSREDRITSLILSGFNHYKKSIQRYSIHDFNKEDIYLNVLEEHGLSVRHLNEMGLMKDMFIDPITEEILRDMEEPTVWLGLLRRAGDLLLTDYSPSETDMAFMRIRGYERLAGAVYKELVNSMRDYLIRQGTGNAAVDMNPFAVWTTINEDPTITLVEGSNPIKNVNEQETVTFMGEGGRGRTSMVARTRVFGENDMGVISEATVDSGDVAINTYTTANPKFNSLRGTTDRYDGKNAGPASLLSTGALISPAADSDDPKRVS